MRGVVLISGSGSNLQAIIDQADNIDLNISCVISNNADAYGLTEQIMQASLVMLLTILNLILEKLLTKLLVKPLTGTILILSS